MGARRGEARVGNRTTGAETDAKVLKLLKLGLSNEQIAERLGLTPGTVRTIVVRVKPPGSPTRLYGV
jgi:DNA-binding CsgD family transcriptional regulator